MGLKRDQLAQVGEINQFVYCPRRHYYITFFDTIGSNYQLKEGHTRHQNKSRRGGWTEEMYLRSEKHRLHGKIDVLDENDVLTPVERKRSQSGSYFESDELQLAAYCMLLEDNVSGSVNVGYIYTESNDKRHKIRIEEWHRDAVDDIVDRILNLKPDDPPDFVDNPNKCVNCSCREYCMPEESRMLGES